MPPTPDIQGSIDQTSRVAHGRSWLKTGAVTSAAAGMVLPLVGEQAAAYQTGATEAIAPPTQTNPANRQTAADATNRSKGIRPTAASTTQAKFSTQAAASSQLPLITQSEDGSWTLTRQPDATVESQSALTQISAAAASTQQKCTDRSCRGVSYIDGQLPKARQEVESLQAQLKAFETRYAQQDMAAYQQVLASRLTEISQQKSQLAISTDQTQQRITQLKMQLVSMDAELGLAARALAESASYQTAWDRLARSEKDLLEEFSKVDIDATALNEIYSDYEYNQRVLQEKATEALGTYLSEPGATIPSFIQRVPESAGYMQALTVATHEYNVQRLRQNTIGQIERRLSAWQSGLAGNIGEYETLQRQLKIALSTLNRYEQERNVIATRGQRAQKLKAQSATALNRAKEIAPKLPNGSTGQAIIYTVLAAGAVAAIAAHRKTKRAAAIPTLELNGANLQRPAQAYPARALSLATDSLKRPQREQQLAGAGSLAVSDAITSTITEPISPATKGLSSSSQQLSLDEILSGTAPLEESTDDFETRILAELMEITNQSVKVVEELAPTPSSEPASTQTDESSGADLTIEMMSRELNELLERSTPEGSLSHEIQSRAIAPVKLSLDEADLFAEHAIRWILKDLGLARPADTLTKAEAEFRAAAGFPLDEDLEDEGIDIESLELTYVGAIA